MSVTFRVAESPTRKVAHTFDTYDGGIETETYEEDILPTCNFSNINAARILEILGIPHEDLCGEIRCDQLAEIMNRIRLKISEGFVIHDDYLRAFKLHTVVDAAAQFRKPVRFS